MKPNPKIFIVDDDKKLQDLLKEYLTSRDYEIYSQLTGGNIPEALSHIKPDVLVLDLMLPVKSGLDVLKDVREKNSIPIMILTARGDEADRIVGLELGADDYLPKPFNPRELDARLRAILRRSKNQKSMEMLMPQIAINGLELDIIKRTVTYSNKKVDLASSEVEILAVLFRAPDTIITRDAIMNYTKGRDFMGYERSIDVHISRLRSKILEVGAGNNRIQTIWGKGYRFLS